MLISMNNTIKILSCFILLICLLLPQKGQGEEIAKSHPKGWQGVIIESVFPNPCDKDKEKEWIKLYNSSNTEINLKNWFLIDNYGRGKGYLFEKDLWLEDDDYIILKRVETKITLNNFKEELYLYTDKDKLADSISYSNAPENFIYKLENQTFSWVHLEKERSDTCKLSNQNNLKEIENTKKYLNWTDLDGAQAEDNFQLTGIVLSPPNTVGKRYFLLSNNKQQSRIIQIYNHYSDFPEIEAGDIIKATGNFSKGKDYIRIKTKSPQDIKINKSSLLISPLSFDLDNLYLNKIYKLEAEINKINKNSLSVIYKNKEIKIDLSLLNNKNLKNEYTEKVKINIVGILTKQSNEINLKLLPSYPQNKNYFLSQKQDNKEQSSNKDYKKYLSLASIISAGFITWKYKKKTIS